MANSKNHALLSDQKIFALTVGLCDEISRAATPAEAANLLTALLTPQEIRMIAIRLCIREMLLGGANYEQIKADLNTSSGTISRVRLALENLCERPRSTILNAPKQQTSLGNPSRQYPKHLRGPMSKYASSGWPVQLLATILREVAEKRPPPK